MTRKQDILHVSAHDVLLLAADAVVPLPTRHLQRCSKNDDHRRRPSTLVVVCTATPFDTYLHVDAENSGAFWCCAFCCSTRVSGRWSQPCTAPLPLSSVFAHVLKCYTSGRRKTARCVAWNSISTSGTATATAWQQHQWLLQTYSWAAEDNRKLLVHW